MAVVIYVCLHGEHHTVVPVPPMADIHLASVPRAVKVRLKKVKTREKLWEEEDCPILKLTLTLKHFTCIQIKIKCIYLS